MPIIGLCFALLGGGFAVDGFLGYRWFDDILDTSSAPYQRSGEMVRLQSPVSSSRYSCVATALIIAIGRFALSERCRSDARAGSVQARAPDDC